MRNKTSFTLKKKKKEMSWQEKRMPLTNYEKTWTSVFKNQVYEWLVTTELDNAQCWEGKLSLSHSLLLSSFVETHVLEENSAVSVYMEMHIPFALAIPRQPGKSVPIHTHTHIYIQMLTTFLTEETKSWENEMSNNKNLKRIAR